MNFEIFLLVQRTLITNKLFLASSEEDLTQNGTLTPQIMLLRSVFSSEL